MSQSGVVVIAAYCPRANCDAALAALVQTHVPSLRRLGLATDRPHVIFQAKDGTLLEVFEWQSADAIHQAHDHPEVQQMWDRFNELCLYEAPANLEECKHLFPGFTPLN
jgi:hypothetical protein